jgi:opacity protein-like surface antigen
MRGRRLDFHARSLVGGAKITGVFPGSTAVSSGFVNKLAWAFGGGIEYSLSVPFSVRTDVDYIHTAFFNPVGFVKGQNNVRVTTSLVYHFGVGR